jgi:hypothetical protein
MYIYSLEVEKKIINHKYLHNVLNNDMIQLATEQNDFHLIQSFNKGDYQSVNNINYCNIRETVADLFHASFPQLLLLHPFSL